MTAGSAARRGLLTAFVSVAFAFNVAPLAANDGSDQSDTQAERKSATRPADSDYEQPGRLGLYAGDIFLPGYGALRQGQWGRAATFFIARVASGWAAYDAYVQMVEYRSAERAARIAVTVNGPGLLFPDPYSNAYRSADEFQRLADRRAAIMSAAASMHVFLTGLSLLLTHAFYENERDARAPIFRLELRAPDSATPENRGPNLAPSGIDFAIRVGL